MTGIRVGVVGVGRMGQRHCRVYSSLRHVDLVGVFDTDHSVAREVGAHYTIPAFDNYSDLLDKVDAVSITTDTPSHFTLASEAIAEGIHIIIEKPIAETLEQGRELERLSASAPTVLQVGHIERFNPAYVELKKIIQDADLVAVNVRRLSPFSRSKTDVNVVSDLMIHDLDLVADLVGNDFELAGAWGRSLKTDSIDYAVANLSCKDGPIVTLTASRVTEEKVRSIEITADSAYIEADLLAKNVTIHRSLTSKFVDTDDASLYRQDGIIERIFVPSVEPLAQELLHFVTCIREGNQVAVPATDGVNALELAIDISNEILSKSDRHALETPLTQAA